MAVTKLKKLAAILLFLVTIVSGYAQQDSVGAVQSIRNLTQEKLNSATDTIKNPVSHNLDSVQLTLSHKADSIRALNPLTKIATQQDSLRRLVVAPDQKTQALQQNAQQQVGFITDSLSKPINKWQEKITGLQTNAQNRLDSLEQKVSTTMSKAPEQVQGKLNGIADKTQELPDVPQTTLPDVNLPNTTIPNIDTTLPSNEIKSDALNVPDANLSIPDMKGDLDIDNLKIDKLQLPDEATMITNEVKSVEGELTDYQQQSTELAKDIPTDANALAQEAEQKLAETTAGQAVKSNLSKVTDEQARYELLIKQYQDQKLIEQELKRKLKDVANDHFAKNASKVQQAQAELEKSKKALNSVKSFKDVFKKRSTELDGLKFYQRLVPGITWQLYNQEPFMTDLGLQVGYRITPRFTAGIGGVYRAGFSKQFEYFVSSMRIYGLRSYFDFTLRKGILFHAEYERLSNTNELTPLQTPPVVNPEVKTRLVHSGYFGLGKRFSISRYLKASTTALYRAEFNGSLPAMSKFQVRFGVEYMFRKRVKRANGLRVK